LLVDTTRVLGKFIGKKDFYIDSGTLLGFVRNNSINQYDHDIDIRILPDKLPEERMADLVGELWQIGFKGIIGNIGKRAELICTEYNTLLKLDLKFAYKDDNLLWVYCWEQPGDLSEPRVHVYPIRFFKKMGTVKFKGRLYPCPTPTEDYLLWHYGKEWRDFKVRAEDANETDLSWDFRYSPPCAMSLNELAQKRKELVSYLRDTSSKGGCSEGVLLKIKRGKN